MSRPPFTERRGHPPGERLAAMRDGMARAVAAGAWPTEPPPLAIDLDGVRAILLSSPGPARATVVHFHSGGYGIGCPEMMAPFARALADRCRVDVICPAYRLAPEHPMPAAVNDAWRAWSAVRRRRGGPFVVSGDSAGGGLAAVVAGLAAERGEPAAGLVLLSAWLDLTVSDERFERNAATDPVFSRARAQASSDAYLQGIDPRNPLASPIFGPADLLPPTLVSVGSGEVLAGDADRLHAALLSAAVPVELSRIDGMEHVAATRGLDRPGALETLEAVARFVDCLLS